MAKELGPAPSAPDISALAKRFVEPLGGDEPAAPRPAFPRPTLVPQAVGLRDTQTATGAEPSPRAAPRGKRWLNRNAMISAVVILALIPLAMLFVGLWQDAFAPRTGNGAGPAPKATAPSAGAETAWREPTQQQSTLEVALSSSDRIEANAGERIGFPVVIDATQALPAQSIVAITALPDGASFSSGRPYGDTGWSLRPDEIGDLRLQLPARSGVSHIRLELVAGDGTVLAQSETQVSVVAPPAATDSFAPVATAPSEPVAAVETTGSIASLPVPTRKPTASADSSVRVNKVKAVTIPAPRAARPHDGAYALAPAQGEPQTSGEWMETKTAVDMHAKAQQWSETVKVADKGLKVRVTARDKNWIQVHDPKTSTTGWIYNRFLKPADSPAQ